MRQFQTGVHALRLSDLTLCLLSLTQLYCALMVCALIYGQGRMGAESMPRQVHICQDASSKHRLPAASQLSELGTRREKKSQKIMTFWSGFNTGRRVATSHVPWMKCNAKTSWPRRRKTSLFPSLLAFFYPFIPFTLFFIFSLYFRLERVL